MSAAANQQPVRYSPSWLSLREAADARARSRDLAIELAIELATVLATGLGAVRTDRLVIHDLGCGTGSMGRWLAPLLPGPQHWVLHDQDPELLDLAAAWMPSRAADGSPVSTEVRQGDVTALTTADLDGAALATASALLDLFTAEEAASIVAACAGASCSALFSLSVLGRVELGPADPLDVAVAAAFNAHQRRTVQGRTVQGRTVQGRTLLGPDGVAAAEHAFAGHGWQVLRRASPWRLGPDDAALAEAWFDRMGRCGVRAVTGPAAGGLSRPPTRRGRERRAAGYGAPRRPAGPAQQLIRSTLFRPE
jgi:hypothetical protein